MTPSIYYTPTTKLPEHDLADCEGLYSYLCDTCAMWYNERADEWAMDKDDRGL